LNLNPNEYFNSGVLLINSKLQRGSDLKEKFMLLSRNKYEFMDQDILNIACVGKVFFMPFNMNVRSHVNPCTMSNDPSYYNHINPDINKVRDLLSNPIIIHYTGAKPWNRFTYFWYEWWNVYQRTIVFDPALEKTIWDGTYNRPISFYQMLLFFLRLSYSRLYKVIKNKVR
jgi:lipopolysaccharide biosynthesis glycosyltransferase